MIKASLILIAATLLLGIVLYIGHRREKIKIRNGETKADAPEQPEIPAECCGAHEICERDSLLAAVSKKIEYYDDEELDQGENSCFRPAKEEYRTGNTEGRRNRETIKQSNRKTFEQSKEEERRKAKDWLRLLGETVPGRELRQISVLETKSWRGTRSARS